MCQAELVDAGACEWFDERVEQWKVRCPCGSSKLEDALEVPDPRELSMSGLASAGPETITESMIAWATRQLILRCDKNPVRLYILASRLGQDSYQAIGARLGISKQAVAKHVRRIGEAQAQLGRVVRHRR